MRLETCAYVAAVVVSAVMLGYNISEMQPDAPPEFSQNLVGVVWSTFLFTFGRILVYQFVIKWFMEQHETPPDPARANKFAQQLLNFVFHTGSSMYLCYNLPRRDWFASDEALWKDYPDQNQDYRDIAVYILQLGYHINCLAIHFHEPRREDHYVMLVHHSATVFLIASSFLGNYVRCGLLVLLYHDSSDVLGCLIKMTNYLNWKTTTLIIFPNMCLVWFVARLYYFPRFLLYTATYQKPFSLTQWVSFPAMTCLVCLHSYWFFLFMKMAYVAITTKGKQVQDLSEDKLDKKRLKQLQTPIPNADAI
jgi:ceramide synthetase